MRDEGLRKGLSPSVRFGRFFQKKAGFLLYISAESGIIQTAIRDGSLAESRKS